MPQVPRKSWHSDAAACTTWRCRSTSRSEMQFRDVRQLLTFVRTLDQKYLDRWAASHTVTDLLREVRS